MPSNNPHRQIIFFGDPLPLKWVDFRSSPVYDYVNGWIVSNDVVMTKANMAESFEFNL